ncbi:hypothetical protein ACIHEJ_07635 [Streptomyces sp. NPDC052301]|uniref:hypothetical protein n=1 Tax=Streptomyces sp. NPDC052301 TaxID=3365687 RepID=UPI0037D7EC39
MNAGETELYGAEYVDALPVHVLAFDDVHDQTHVDATKEAAAILALLSRLGAVPEPGAPQAVTWDLNTVEERLAHWAASGGERTSVLLWIGHGKGKNRQARLLVPGNRENTRAARVVPQTLAWHLHDEASRRVAPHWAFVVVEACGSWGFVDRVAEELSAVGATAEKELALLLVGSGQHLGPGHLGTFREKMAEVLDGFTDHDKDIEPGELAHRLNAHDGVYARAIGCSRQLPLRPRTAHPLPVTATVEDYDRLHRLLDTQTDNALAHFLRSGVCSGFTELTWGFTGRAADRRSVARWAADPHTPGMLIVTGASGAGKSALLGNLMLHAYPAVGQELHAAGFADRLDPDLVLPAVDAVVHLAGSTLDDVVGRLTTLLGIAPTEPGLALQERITALRKAVEGRASTVIMADALDEAREPLLVAGLLRELAPLTGVRLVVGTRPTAPAPVVGHRRPGDMSRAPEGRTPGADPVPPPGRGTRATSEELLDALGRDTGHAQVHTLERDAEAVHRYVTRSLRGTPGGPLAAERGSEAVDGVADIVRERVENGDWEFLQASLVVQEIQQSPELLRPERLADLNRLLAHDQRGLFNSAVGRIAEGFPQATPLLAALAHAQGRGLPRAGQVWATVAGALDPGGVAPTDADIARLLHRAAAYVLLDGEDGHTVHRLAHRTFADKFLERSGPHERAAVLRALVALAEHRVAAAPDVPLPGHLARHLSAYAAEAGPDGWRELAGRPRVLDRIDVPALAGDVLSAGLSLTSEAPNAGRLPGGVLGTVASAHLIRAARPGDRPGLRQLGAARTTGEHTEAGPDAAWRVCWSRMARHFPHLPLDGHVRPVKELVTWEAETTVLASGAEDGTVLLWEPWAGHAPVAALPGPLRSSLLAMAALPSGGGHGPRLAVAHNDRRVRIWDLGDTPAVHAETDVPTILTGMAAVPGPRPRLALVGTKGYVALWDLTRPADRPRSGAQPGGRVHSVVSVAQRRLVTVDEGGYVKVWDASGEAPQSLVSDRPATPPTALAVLPGAPGVVRFASAHTEDAAGDAKAAAEVTFWTLTDDGLAQDGEPLHTGESALTAIGAITVPRGGTRLVTAARDGSLYLWNPRTRTRTGVLRDGAPAPTVRILPFTGPTRVPLPATAARRDSAVRLWSPHESGTPAGAAGPGDADDVDVTPDPGGRAAPGDPAGRALAGVTSVDRALGPDGEELLLLGLRDGTRQVCSAADGADRPAGSDRPAPLTGTPPALPDKLGARLRDWAVLDRRRTALALDDGVIVVEALCRRPAGQGETESR